MPSGPQQLRVRPVASPEYQSRLPRLGPQHGSDWDCGRECSKCEDFRVIERAAWDKLSEQEKSEVRFYAWRSNAT